MREINRMNWVSGKQIAVFYPWGNKWPSVSAITKSDPNSKFLNPFASRHHQLFWLNVTHSSLCDLIMFCWLKLEMFILQFLLCIINQAQLVALPRPFPSLLVQPHFIFSHTSKWFAPNSLDPPVISFYISLMNMIGVIMKYVFISQLAYLALL